MSAEVVDRALLKNSANLVAGAVVGVLGTLLVLSQLISSIDSHYVTRREYEATLVGIRQELAFIRTVQYPAHTRAPGASPDDAR